MLHSAPHLSHRLQILEFEKRFLHLQMALLPHSIVVPEWMEYYHLNKVLQNQMMWMEQNHKRVKTLSTSWEPQQQEFDLELGFEIQKLKKKEIIWFYKIRFAVTAIIALAIIAGYLFKYYQVYEEMQIQREILLIQYQDCHFHLAEEEKSWFEALVYDGRLSRCIEAKKEIGRLNLWPNPFELLLTHYIFPIFQFSSLTICLMIIMSLLLLLHFVRHSPPVHQY